MGYCLPDSITSISFSNPETSSRVTLATLGIVFQTKLITNYKHGAECWLEASTEQSESNPGRSLGTITMKRRAVWKTVPPTERSIRVNPINPCSKKNSEEVKRTRIQRILSEMECCQKRNFSIHFLLPLKQIRHGNNRLDYIRISIPL